MRVYSARRAQVADVHVRYRKVIGQATIDDRISTWNATHRIAGWLVATVFQLVISVSGS